MKSDSAAVRNEAEALRLLHELEVHQIELQMQNAELRLARDEAEAVLEKYTDLYDFAPVAYFTLDAKGTIRMVNLTGSGLVGIDRSRLIGRSFERLVSPELRPAFKDLLRRVFEDQTRQSIETELLHQGRLPTAVNIEVRNSPGGRECRVVAVDITERKQADEDLMKSQELLAMAIDGGRFGIWSWDLVADKLIWNARCKEMVGLPTDTEMNLAVALGTIHPEDRARIHDEITRALEIRVAVQFEYRVVLPDGSMRWMHTRGCKFEDAARNPICFTGTMLDVTERRETEEELRRFNVELESLVRQRTAVVEVTLLELREEIDERRRLEVEILGIGERARAAIGQDLHDELGQQLVGIGILMDVLSGELSAEAHPLAADALQLTHLLTRSLDTTRNLAKSLYPVELERGGLFLALQGLARRTELLSGIVCTVHSDAAFRFAKAAEIHLYRIVQESIGNALKHGKAHHIAIDCTARKGTSTLTVTDDGRGFELPVEGIGAGIGLHLFQYRARVIGAGITVTPGKNGGCRVTCTMGKLAATLPGG